MKLAILALPLLVTGCMSIGVQKMTPEQIKATEGMLTCDNIFSVYARGNSASVHLDRLHKGMNSNSKITVNPDCGITIESSVSQPVPMPLNPAVGGRATPPSLPPAQ